MFNALPSSMVMYLFEFLSVKDINSVMKSCKRFSNIVNEHNKFWIRECLRPYLSYDLEEYCELYDDDDYKCHIKSKMYYFQKKVWKKSLEEGVKLKINFANTLKQIASPERADSFINYFYETLKQPCIPLAKLKRETIICTTQTLFQTKLSEVLYEDSGMINAFFSGDHQKETIDSLRNYEKRFFQEMVDYEKNEILKIRWYLFDQKDNESEDTLSNGDRCDLIFDPPCLKKFAESYSAQEETRIIQNNKAFLIGFFESFYNIISHFCGLISEYLNSLDNVYDVLAEYTARWKCYVCTIIEFEKTFETFADLLN